MSRRPLLAIPIAVFAIALLALLVRGSGESKPPLPRQQAVHAALADPAIHRELASHGWDHGPPPGVGSKLARVAFFGGARNRAVAGVGGGGGTEPPQNFSPGAPQY